MAQVTADLYKSPPHRFAMAALVAELHGMALRQMSEVLGVHCQGLSQASRMARHRGLIANGTAKRLVHLDSAHNVLRHITRPFANDFLAGLPSLGDERPEACSGPAGEEPDGYAGGDSVDGVHGVTKHEDMESAIPMDLVDVGGNTDMDQTEADTKESVEAAVDPNTGHQARHQQEVKLENTANDHNKVTTVGTAEELAVAAKRTAREALFRAAPAEALSRPAQTKEEVMNELKKKQEAALRVRCEVSAILARDHAARTARFA
jgi:hypothetical protein